MIQNKLNMSILTVTSSIHSSDGYFVDLINDQNEVITIHPFNQEEFNKYSQGTSHDIDLSSEDNQFMITYFPENPIQYESTETEEVDVPKKKNPKNKN